MFQQVTQTIREAVYGIKCSTPIENNRAACSMGTGFMIAEGVIVTAAHVIHFPEMGAQHQKFEVIRAPDIGQIMEIASLIAEDTAQDIALLRIEHPRSPQSLILEPNRVNIGTSCGSLGFPLAFLGQQGQFLLDLRFQGAFVSSYNPIGNYYETDSLMYKGSSGCPGYILNGRVFGMHNKVINKEPSSAPQPPLNRQQRRQQMRHQQRSQAAHVIQEQKQTDRYAISMWVPSSQIITFAHSHGITA